MAIDESFDEWEKNTIKILDMLGKDIVTKDKQLTVKAIDNMETNQESIVPIEQRTVQSKDGKLINYTTITVMKSTKAQLQKLKGNSGLVNWDDFMKKHILDKHGS